MLPHYRPGDRAREKLKGRLVVEGELEAGHSQNLPQTFPTDGKMC